MAEEMLAHKKNGAWDIVSLPEGKKPVIFRWFYHIKHNPDGSIDRKMLGCEPIGSPKELNHGLEEYSYKLPTDKGQYQRFMHNPGQQHMDAVIMILRYLKSVSGRGLMFSKHGHLDVSSYTDSDWGGKGDRRRSTSGYVTFVGGNFVTWKSKKQQVVSLSSAEAEYMTMVKGICELL
ncbi:uncharacterized protein LOC113325183 [Papaver somniferum]|uniref:uncharacterized protein LOC113325183 n=1 Tax=Papaver somniferum TaxID=3469 RepID=UPI000E6F91DD|nr:uncharacterized protein LOC113325183 [Papaver somniferum]